MSDLMDHQTTRTYVEADEIRTKGTMWAADEIAWLRSMVRRAMEHGVNGSDHYHAIKASELGNEMRGYLKVIP